MTNKLVVIINSLEVPKMKKILLYEMKFLVPNHSCLQNPWLAELPPSDPRSLCPQLNLLKPPLPRKNSWVRHCMKIAFTIRVLNVLAKSRTYPDCTHSCCFQHCHSYDGRLRLKCDGTRAENPDFVFAVVMAKKGVSWRLKQHTRIEILGYDILHFSIDCTVPCFLLSSCLTLFTTIHEMQLVSRFRRARRS